MVFKKPSIISQHMKRKHCSKKRLNCRIDSVLILILLIKVINKKHCLKNKFSIKDFFSKCDQFCSFLVISTEEILNGKLHFLCSEVQ